MTDIPQKLADILADFELLTNRNERADYLVDISGRFRDVKVTPEIATPPYDEARRVPACESDAFVWPVEQADGTLRFYFDVLNPQGLSAMALAVILNEGCSGAPLEQVAAVQPDIVFTLFGREISMGKGQGLTSMVSMVQYQAKKRL
jgi:cysteine desulfuration protein SufE